MNESSNTPATPTPPAKRALSPRWRSDAPFPENLGLGLGLCFAVGVIGVLIVSAMTVRHEADLRQRESSNRIAEQLAGAIAARRDLSADELSVQLLEPCSTFGFLRAARWADAGGKSLLDWRCLDRKAQIASSEVIAVSAPVPAESGPPGTLSLELALPAPTIPKQLMWLGAALATPSLIGYLWLYRRLRQRMRPYAAIQRNLNALASGIEKNLATLSLSDSMGQVARGWNQLVDIVAQAAPASGATQLDSSGAHALERLELRKFRESLDSLPIGVLRVNQEGVVRYANSAAAQLLGRKPESLADAHVADALSTEAAETLLSAARRAALTHSVDQTLGEGDEQRVLRVQLTPPARPNEAERVLAVQDVTHLQEVERARDRFLYHVTHELRTPLTNIQAYAETLTKPDFEDEETRRECYNVIISETRRLSRLVEDVLSVSQLEVGTARIERRDVDIQRLLRQIVQDNLGHADEKSIDLRLILPPKIPRVVGDKERLASLVNNLVGNAIKYTPSGGSVVVELRVDPKVLRLLVSDTGIGISPEDQARVFEKFYRAGSDEVLAQPGTGLGLAIAREIARTHGGEIRLQSTPGVGSTFEVELPRPNEDGAEEAAR